MHCAGTSRYVASVKKLDIALALAATTWMLVEVWTESLQPTDVVAPLMAVGGLALAWRRPFPIPVALVLVGALLGQTAVGVSMQGPVAPVMAMFLVAWSIGAYEERRQAILGLTLLVCGVWIAMGVDALRGTDHWSGTDFPYIGGLVLTPGILGIAFGARTRTLRAAEARSRELDLERREAIASERARIARELHDVIAHTMSVMTVQAGAAEEMLRVDPARALEPVQAVQEAGRQALVEMKRLVGVLREDHAELGLEPQPGLADVERLVGQVRGAGLRVELRVEGEPRPLPLGVDLSAYRVVQEALTNALKHAGGAPAVVTIRYGNSDVEIEVADEGRHNRSGEGGHGLVGMRERVGIFGGTFHAGPRESGGFAVRALLPLGGPG
jgi:signal transduction histidine kinase